MDGVLAGPDLTRERPRERRQGPSAGALVLVPRIGENEKYFQRRDVVRLHADKTAGQGMAEAGY